jgi:hypothetical protein
MFPFLFLSPSGSCSYPRALKIIVFNPEKRKDFHMSHTVVSLVIYTMCIDLDSPHLILGCWFDLTHILPDIEMSC